MNNYANYALGLVANS